MADNLLCIDYGSVRVGLATAEGGATLASPLKTLANKSGIFDELHLLISDHQIKHIVVGLPRNLDGNETAQSRMARDFAARLERELKVPVTLQDEALTSQVARKRLEPSYPKGIPVGLVDAAAAAIILQDYMDTYL